MTLNKSLKSAAKHLPGIRRLVHQRDDLHAALLSAQDERQSLLRSIDALMASPAIAPASSAQAPSAAEDELARLRQACGFVPPGHYYSPIPALAEIRRDEARIFGPLPRQLAGIDMREAEQLALLYQLLPYYADQPFGDQPREGLRYHLDNPAYAHSDGLLLHCLLRHLKPQRLIEVGSGYSSCVTLDTNEHFLGGGLQTTFIEPYPERLMSLLRPADRERVTLHAQRLQDMDLAVFATLQANDVLFIDSTHVSRVDSDVNHLFFEILPALAPGVVIHVHDMFWPFEYPKDWIYEGRAWNELYLMRAFLQYNSRFEVLLMNAFMEIFHTDFFTQHMPLCLKQPGASLWLRKLGR